MVWKLLGGTKILHRHTQTEAYSIGLVFCENAETRLKRNKIDTRGLTDVVMVKDEFYLRQ